MSVNKLVLLSFNLCIWHHPCYHHFNFFARWKMLYRPFQGFIYLLLTYTSAVLQKSPDLVCASKEDPLEREKGADVIITGTVVNILQGDDGSGFAVIYKGQVLVRRVIKGSSPDIESMGVIQVENFGDQTICDSQVSKRDTRIFFMKKGSSPGSFRLSSSICRLTLKNLDQIAAISKGKVFHRPKL